jgi:hypothetical protein
VVYCTVLVQGEGEGLCLTRCGRMEGGCLAVAKNRSRQRAEADLPCKFEPLATLQA